MIIYEKGLWEKVFDIVWFDIYKNTMLFAVKNIRKAIDAKFSS